MTRSAFAIVSAIVIAGGVISWRVQHQAAGRLRETNQAAQELAAQLARLQEEDLRLADKLAQRRPVASLPGDQFRELLRLRGEVGRLHGDRREANQLHATNQQLLETLARSERATTNLARWDRDQIAFAGYADPVSAMLSTLWGLNSGDPDFQSSWLTSDHKAQLEKAGKFEQIAASYGQIAELLYPSTATGISVIGSKSNTPDEAAVDLYYEGEGKTRQFVLRRVAGEWKLHQLVSQSRQ
jgi:hypothetical protein